MDENNVTDEDRQNWSSNNDDDTNTMADMKKDEKLDQDYDTPFSPPSGVQDRIRDDDPRTDTNIDLQEHYDEGIEGASSSDLPGRSADEGETEPPLDDIEE